METTTKQISMDKQLKKKGCPPVVSLRNLQRILISLKWNFAEKPLFTGNFKFMNSNKYLQTNEKLLYLTKNYKNLN